MCLVADFDFVSSVFFSAEAVSLLHWLQVSISLWSGSFCRRCHKVGRQVLVFCHFGWCNVGNAITDSFVNVGIKVCLTNVIISKIVVTGTFFRCILISHFFELATLVSVVTRLFAVMTSRFGFLRI